MWVKCCWSCITFRNFVFAKEFQKNTNGNMQSETFGSHSSFLLIPCPDWWYTGPQGFFKVGWRRDIPLKRNSFQKNVRDSSINSEKLALLSLGNQNHLVGANLLYPYLSLVGSSSKNISYLVRDSWVFQGYFRHIWCNEDTLRMLLQMLWVQSECFNWA